MKAVDNKDGHHRFLFGTFHSVRCLLPFSLHSYNSSIEEASLLLLSEKMEEMGSQRRSLLPQSHGQYMTASGLESEPMFRLTAAWAFNHLALWMIWVVSKARGSLGATPHE